MLRVRRVLARGNGSLARGSRRICRGHPTPASLLGGPPWKPGIPDPAPRRRRLQGSGCPTHLPTQAFRRFHLRYVDGYDRLRHRTIHLRAHQSDRERPRASQPATTTGPFGLPRRLSLRLHECMPAFAPRCLPGVRRRLRQAMQQARAAHAVAAAAAMRNAAALGEHRAHWTSKCSSANSRGASSSILGL